MRSTAGSGGLRVGQCVGPKTTITSKERQMTENIFDAFRRLRLIVDPMGVIREREIALMVAKAKMDFIRRFKTET